MVNPLGRPENREQALNLELGQLETRQTAWITLGLLGLAAAANIDLDIVPVAEGNDVVRAGIATLGIVGGGAALWKATGLNHPIDTIRTRLDMIRKPEEDPQAGYIESLMDSYRDKDQAWTELAVATDLQQRVEEGDLTHPQAVNIAERLGLYEY